ncbi:hypothetical protein D1AOALGA4SA_12332 [Olavius algarvensis Delta 1 endosymbiont]|nr:hypothetical protein D1AOALGA4SA_12332 [Olavius algarvensis Delta 1 endosymbiont]
MHLRFNGKYVSVQGTLTTPLDNTAASNSTQGPPAILNVISLSLAPLPESRTPTIYDVTALAISGSHPWVTIMCKFSDIADEPEDRAYFLGMYGDTEPGLNHYWQEQSYDTADITGSTVGTDWYTLPETELHYNPTDTGQGTDLSELAEDCIAEADADVDYSIYTGINMMFNSDFDNGWAWGGTRYMTLDGETRIWSVTWEPPWAYSDISVIAHEMGHGFGLPHSTAPGGGVYDNPWDVMSQDRYNCAPATDPTYGCMAQHTISQHKDILDWIPGPRKITIESGKGDTVTLEDLAAPASSNYQMAKIPIGGSANNFYTVESRRFTGYDSKLPDEGVIIHEVDTGSMTVLVPDSGDREDPWNVGETFIDTANDIAVCVNADTGTGFEVTISNGDPISLGLCWLRQQQQANGSWQDFVGYTAMASLAFLNAGLTEDDEVVSKGINYLLSYVQTDGGIYNYYHNYETALSILALKATENTDYTDEITNAANYLKSIQSDDSDDPDYSWYGGWGYAAYHKNIWSDLSNSQFSAMALDAAEVPKGDMVWTRFLRFLSRVQNLDDNNDMPWADGRTDGGFTYSPHYSYPNPSFNYASYGSMTAAGLWGLRLSDVEIADNRVQAALGWLQANEDLNFLSNPPLDNDRRYYYYLSFAKAMAMCFLSQDDAGAWYEGWYDALRSKIASEQEEEGHWNQAQGAYPDTLFALLTLQAQQPLPADLWMSIILASPADLIIYDPQDRLCSKDECNIPGAEFVIDGTEQIVNLHEVEPGHYRFVFVGTGDGTVHLMVNKYRDDDITNTVSKEFEIKNYEILESDVLVSSLIGALTIDVEEPELVLYSVAVDIKPQSCPNPLNTKSKGVLPVAVLGAEDFDVTKIDPASMFLKGVPPIRWALEDVATPFEPTINKEDCFEDCNNLGPDGYMDLTLKFKTQEIVADFDSTQDGDCMVLSLTGHLREKFNSTPILGEDVVHIQKKKEVKKKAKKKDK